MLLEVFSHAMAFDLEWFVPFIMENLIWVFFLACLAHFIYGKGLVFGTAFVAIYLYATFDFAAVFGWVFRKGFFWVPVIGFIALLAYDSFFGKKGFSLLKRPWLASTVFYLGLLFINVILE